MNNDCGIIWIDGFPIETNTGLPSGRIFFDSKFNFMKSKFECKSKRQYDSRDDANKYIYDMMVESLSNTTFLRSYKCKYCKKWHLTSSDR